MGSLKYCESLTCAAKVPRVLKSAAQIPQKTTGALGRNRTYDLRFRKPLLYPLSYEGGDGAKCGAKFADTPHVIYIEVTGVRSESKECAQNL